MSRRRRLGPVGRRLLGAVDLLGHHFPGLLVLGELIGIYFFARNPQWPTFVALVLAPYLIPLGLYRLMVLFAPVEIGRSALAKDVWSSWFLSYRLQVIYGHFPFLEGALFSVPGLYSLWLRAWGSKVGRRVFWACTARVTDRGHLIIGSDTFFGHDVYLSPHVVRRKGERGVLYFKPITIGSRCFIGAGSRMGPGVVVHSDSSVPLLTDLYLNEEFPPSASVEATAGE